VPDVRRVAVLDRRRASLSTRRAVLWAGQPPRADGEEVGMTAPVMTYSEAREALRCGATKLKELMRHGRIVRASQHGRAGLVTRASVEAELLRMSGATGGSTRLRRRRPSPQGVRLPARPEA